MAPQDLMQRDDALKKANQVRIGRAELKRALQAGRRDPVKIVSNPRGVAKGLKVYEFLTSVQKIGESKAERILAEARVSPNRTLERLTEPQRAVIVHALTKGAGDEHTG